MRVVLLQARGQRERLARPARRLLGLAQVPESDREVGERSDPEVVGVAPSDGSISLRIVQRSRLTGVHLGPRIIPYGVAGRGNHAVRDAQCDGIGALFRRSEEGFTNRESPPEFGLVVVSDVEAGEHHVLTRTILRGPDQVGGSLVGFERLWSRVAAR